MFRLLTSGPQAAAKRLCIGIRLSDKCAKRLTIWAQVPVADAVFQEVRKVKAPLLTRACQRLLTEDRFAGAPMFDAMRRPYVDVLASSDVGR